MKALSKRTILAALALAIAWAFSSSAGATEKVQAARHEDKAAAVAEGNRLVAALDEKIAAMKKDIAKSNAELKKAHEANMKELEAKRQTAAAELQRLQQATASTWDATKQAFVKAYKDLQAGVDKAGAESKSK